MRPDSLCRGTVNPLIRRKSLSFVLLAIWLAVFWLQPIPVHAEDSEVIKTVKLNLVTKPPAPPRIEQRIAASVKTVAERLLVGRETVLVSASPQSYEKLIQDVLDRVLDGYSVQQVAVKPGVSTQVFVMLEPWGEAVRDVRVEVDFSAADPLILPFLRQELGDIEKSISSIFLGLPVDSLDWADTVAKSGIRDIVDERLPEYRAAVDIIPGQTTQVKILLSPVGEVVREARLSMRSETIPNIMLYDMRPQVELYAKALRGLPTAFVERKQSVFVEKLEQTAVSHPYAKAYLLDIRAEIAPGADTDIQLGVESRKYRVNAEAWLDMGRDHDNTSGLLHAGKYVSQEDELFMEVRLITNSMKWQFSPGWSHQLGSKTFVGARFNVTDNIQYAWLEQYSGNWRLRFDRSSKTGDNEIGLRYKLHDFLSAELVHREDENFIRVIGQL